MYIYCMKKSRNINIRVNEEEWKTLRNLIDNYKINFSAFVKAALKRYEENLQKVGNVNDQVDESFSEICKREKD